MTVLIDHQHARAWVVCPDCPRPVAVDTDPTASAARLAVTCPLTDQQRDLLALVADGHTADAIARRSGVCVDTVKNRLRTVYRLLGVAGRAEAVAVAFRNGWLS